MARPREGQPAEDRLNPRRNGREAIRDGHSRPRVLVVDDEESVVIPSLMVFCALILRPRINRIANIALGIVYALTIIAGAIGEWNYYILGSAIEVVLLTTIVYYARTWPESPPSTTGREVTPHDIQRTAPYHHDGG